MKYRTALIIVIAALIGCSYVGTAGASYSTPHFENGVEK